MISSTALVLIFRAIFVGHVSHIEYVMSRPSLPSYCFYIWVYFWSLTIIAVGRICDGRSKFSLDGLSVEIAAQEPTRMNIPPD